MTDEKLRELRVAIKREALLEYRDALEKNRSSVSWSRETILYDIEDWADDLEFRERMDDTSND